MSSPSIRVKRAVTETGRFAVSTGAPSTLSHGELAVIFPDNASVTPASLGETVYVGAADGVAVAIGGSGTFATRAYVDDKVTSVFVYKGKITSFFPAADATFPLNLNSTLSQVTGSYYSIDSDYPGNPDNDDPGVVGTDKNAVAISWTEGAASKTLLVKKGDSIVKTATGWEKFDNVDVEVHGTASEIAVTGDENAGYTVAIDSVFSGRVSTAEGDIDALEGRADDLESKTQNFDLAGTTAGNTQINGQVTIVGQVTTNSGVDIGAGLSVASTTTLLGKLTVSSDGFEVTGNSTLTGGLAVTAGISAGDLSAGGNLTVTGSTALQGNLVGSGTNEITDFIIDGGVF